MKRIICLVVYLSLIAATLQAAPKLKTPKRTGSRRISNSLHTPKLPRGSGALGASMGLNYHIMRLTMRPAKTEKMIFSSSSAPSSRSNRPWLNRQTRNLQAWKLRKRIRKQESISLESKQYAQALKQEKASLPQLSPERAFIVTTLADYTPLIQSLEEIPTLPFIEENNQVAYRGLALPNNARAIRNILTNGMRTRDVSPNSNTYLRALSAGSPGTLKVLSTFPSISITKNPVEAANWGKLRLSNQDFSVLTIVKMKGNFQGKSKEFIMDDIAVDQIKEVVTLLDINGNLTWCKTQLNQDHTLTLTPYELPHPQK